MYGTLSIRYSKNLQLPPEIPPFTDESVLQLTFKLMAVVVVMVMMMILATLIFHQNLHPNKIGFEPNLNLMF